MITQIKKWGDSKIIVLNPEYIEYKQLQVGNWVEIKELNKIPPTAEELVDDLNKGGENETNNKKIVE